MKILIIDDEESFCQNLKPFLERKNYEVICSYTGKEGLEVFKKEKPPLVFLDYYLEEGLTGDKILEEIKKINPSCRVVLITGSPEDLSEALLKKGASLYLSKPLNLSTLKEVLERLTQGKEEQ